MIPRLFESFADSVGPDGLKGGVLKTYLPQLGPVFARLSQLFSDSMSVPPAWKSSFIIPVQKKKKKKPNIKHK